MREFLLLLKCDLLGLFKGGKNKSKGGKVVFTGAMVLLFAILIVFVSCVYTALFATVLPSEEKHLAFSIIILLYCVCFLFSTVGTSRTLFGGADYDFLASLPIRPKIVILSKLAYVYIIGLGGALLAIGSSAITYMIICKSGAITLLNALLLIPFLPLLPLLIGLIIGTLFHIAMSKVKRKALVGMILGGAFLVAYLCFMFSVGINDANDEEIGLAILSMAGILKPFTFFAKILTGNYLNLLIVASALSLVSFIYVATLGKYYNKVNDLITSKRSGKSADLTKQKQSSLLLTLVKREVKSYFSNSTVVLNSLIGNLMAIVMPIILLVNGGINSFNGGDAVSGDIQLVIGKLTRNAVPYIPFFFIGLSEITAFSISLEGKNLWFIKSLPVSARDWLKSKLVSSVIFSIPCGIISVILFAVAFSFTWYDALIAIAMVCLYAVVGALFGIVINLKFPRFDWSNPAEIVKRGASMTICTFVGMLVIIPILAIQILASAVSPYLGFALVFALLLGLACLFHNLSFKNIEDKLLNM